MTTNCTHCKTRQARIIHDGPKCWRCYYVEQKMQGNEEWRDTYRQEYMQSHDMVQRPEETPTNLYNRCKRLAMQSGFKINGGA